MKSIISGLLVVCSACAQQIDDYIDQQVQQLVSARLGQRRPGTQTEPISLSRGSTSLVDESSTADVVAIGLGLAGIGENQAAASTQPMSASATVYALYAAAQGSDPMDPVFYNAHRDLRRFGISLGQEDGIPDNPDMKSRATLFSFKTMLWNQRDASVLVNDATQMKALVAALSAGGSAKNRIQRRLIEFVGQRVAPQLTGAKLADFRAAFIDDVGPTLAQLSPGDRAEINRILTAELESVVASRQAIDAVYASFKGRPQLSVEFQTAQRPNLEADIFRGHAIFDVGLLPRLSTTINAGYEYTDVKRIGADVRGARVAGELKLQLTRPEGLSLRNPVGLSFAGESKTLTGTSDIRRVQLKLNLPLLQGVDFPLSFGWANRAELLTEVGTYGKFGLTIDWAKLAQVFH